MRQDLIAYLQHQINTTDARLRRFTHDVQGNVYPKRLMFAPLDGYIQDFLEKKSATKMVVMPGFRGVGKTTLMSQLCVANKNKVTHVLFLSIEDAMTLFNVGILGLMSAYEEILGTELESITDPILVFLDEIQSDPKWAVSLKSLFEKTSRLFFCCTGSAAVVLQSTSNLARRAVFEKVPPMSFTEYELVKKGIPIPAGLGEKIRDALYLSGRADMVHARLLKLKPSVHQYWATVARSDIKKYLSYGTLPFALTMPNDLAVYDAISLLLDKVIAQDLPSLGHFDTATLNAVKRMLFVIAENDVTSLGKLEDVFKINRLTIGAVFDALEKAELLLKIPAYGSNMGVAKKAAKYLFSSPAIRMAFFFVTGRESTYLTRQGRLLEDAIGSHLYREFVAKGRGAIRYDSAEGGADFILQLLNRKQILIEVGMGNKDHRQLIQSQKKIESDYNLLFSNSDLSLNSPHNSVSVPLDYYFLM
jgi:predicted AAA+ superfamily ATPase